MADRASEGSHETAEVDLLARLRAGDPAAFGELIDRWQGDLLRFLRLLGADAHEAEDAVQETFFKLYSTRRRYRRLVRGSFRSLLLRIARNAWVDHLRRRGRRPSTVALESAAGVPDGGSSPNAAEDRLDLLGALSRLGDKHREVVVLNVFEGLGYAEIAATLDVPVGTVKSRMFYALRVLREVLDGE